MANGWELANVCVAITGAIVILTPIFGLINYFRDKHKKDEGDDDE